MLNELNRAGHLKPNSKFQDLALLMGLVLKWSDGQEDYGYDPEDLEWRNSVVAYAKKGGIDLTTIPLLGAQKLVEGVKDNEIPAKVKADQWDIKNKVCRKLTLHLYHARRNTNTFAQYKGHEAARGTQQRANGKPKLGGTQYDITKMSSEERASYNFDSGSAA